MTAGRSYIFRILTRSLRCRFSMDVRVLKSHQLFNKGTVQLSHVFLYRNSVFHIEQVNILLFRLIYNNKDIISFCTHLQHYSEENKIKFYLFGQMNFSVFLS